MRPDDPLFLSPDQRAREIARLLAAGVRRLLAAEAPRTSAAVATPEQSRQSLQNVLALSPEKSVTVQPG